MVEHHNTSWRTFLAIWAGIALVLLALVPRFLGLDAKPAMHDESMFAFYA
jgi:predicted membrane-bound mannosyltransferase